MTDEDIITRLAKLLRDEATILDRWATESRSGGWSTHQVDPMRKRADEIRRELDRLGRL